MDEIKLKQSGIIETDDYINAARLSGANAVLLVENNSYIINTISFVLLRDYTIKLISTQTGEILFISTFFSMPSKEEGIVINLERYESWKNDLFNKYFAARMKKLDSRFK